MASANFIAFDRTLRRMYMMNLVEQLANQRSDGFRASLVVNGRTGLPSTTVRETTALRRSAADHGCAAAA